LGNLIESTGLQPIARCRVQKPMFLQAKERIQIYSGYSGIGWKSLLELYGQFGRQSKISGILAASQSG
jgi:hypothetical protein